MSTPVLDDIDRRIVVATQDGLELVREPYRAVARRVGIDEAEVRRRLAAMQARGVIRRIGAVPNHYALGYLANGMTVWDVPDDRVRELGRRLGGLGFVSHCYHRPRHLPDWPFNLFAMVHGRDRATVQGHVAGMAALMEDVERGHRVLYSTRILKKTGLRLAA